MFRIVDQRYGSHYPLKLPRDKRDVRGLDSHIGAGANGDAHVRLGQGGSVVDSVTHHAHHLTLTLEPLDLQGLVLRQDLGKDSRYPHLSGNGLGRSWVVPSEHHNL